VVGAPAAVSKNPTDNSRLALKHLKRTIPKPKAHIDPYLESTTFPEPSYSSPLDPTSTVHICTFSPCLEQVQKTVSELRNQGWLEIEMVEIAQRRIEVRRERVGLHEEGLRGVNPSAATVEEAVARLKEVESSTKEFHENANANGAANSETAGDQADGMSIDGLTITPPSGTSMTSKRQRLESIKDALAERKIYKEGRLIHRSEPELKTHTSYLVFAILPREWTEEDEEACRVKWPSRVEVNAKDAAKSRRQMKREAKRKGEGGGGS
jgi:tRNA (adenine57-N1/adenine58-N1)-methyltransferase catalytic subunit